MFPPLWTGDRYIKKGEEGYDDLWDYHKQNPQGGAPGGGGPGTTQTNPNEPLLQPNV